MHQDWGGHDKADELAREDEAISKVYQASGFSQALDPANGIEYLSIKRRQVERNTDGRPTVARAYLAALEVIFHLASTIALVLGLYVTLFHG